jgi:hypothetical protein
MIPHHGPFTGGPKSTARSTQTDSGTAPARPSIGAGATLTRTRSRYVVFVHASEPTASPLLVDRRRSTQRSSGNSSTLRDDRGLPSLGRADGDVGLQQRARRGNSRNVEQRGGLLVGLGIAVGRDFGRLRLCGAEAETAP